MGVSLYFMTCLEDIKKKYIKMSCILNIRKVICCLAYVGVLLLSFETLATEIL